MILLLDTAALAPRILQQWPSSLLTHPASIFHSERTSPSQMSWAGVPGWDFSPAHSSLWCPHPACLEDPGSRTQGLPSRIPHLGDLTSQPTSGSHCVFFIRHSHKTIVNLKLNYTLILLSPACEFTPKSCDLVGGVGVGRGLFFFPFSRASHSFSRDKVDWVWGRDTGPSTEKAWLCFWRR